MYFIKGQGTSDHAGYFFAGYGYFPYPDVTGMVYKHPDIRKFNLEDHIGGYFYLLLQAFVKLSQTYVIPLKTEVIKRFLFLWNDFDS